MTTAAQKLLEQALLLQEEDRFALVDKLLGSLDHPEMDADYQASWEKEIARRLEEMDKGTARFVHWEEVRQQLFANDR